MTAAETTVPMIAPSARLTRPSGSGGGGPGWPSPAGSAAVPDVLAPEGLDEDGPFGIGEVRAHEGLVHPAEPIAELVQVAGLGDEEQGGGALGDLRAGRLEVLRGDAGPLEGLAERPDRGPDDR